MGKVSRVVHGYVLSRDYEGSEVPIAEAGGDDCDGLCGYVHKASSIS